MADPKRDDGLADEPLNTEEIDQIEAALARLEGRFTRRGRGYGVIEVLADDSPMRSPPDEGDDPAPDPKP